MPHHHNPCAARHQRRTPARSLSAFRIGGADLRIIRTADSVHVIAAHVAAGTGIGVTVVSALDHQPPGLRVIPLTGPSTTADQVVLTSAEPSDSGTALRDLLLRASAAARSSPGVPRRSPAAVRS